MAAGNRALAFLSLDDQTKAGFASFKRSLGEAGNLLGGFKAQLAGVLSAATGAAFLTSTVRQLDELADAAERTGRSASELSQLQFAFKLTGASAEDIGKAMKALSLELSKAKQGSKEQAELFKSLKIDVSGIENTTQALEALAEAFPKLTDLDRLRVARELLGRGGEALVPALKDGPEALRRLREEAEQLQPGIEGAAKAANEFGDAWDRAVTAMRGSLLPAITQGLGSLTELLNQFRDGIKISGSFFGALRDFATINPFRDTASNLREIRKEIDATIRSIGEFTDAGLDTSKLEESLSRLARQRTFLQQQQAREALQGRTGDAFLDARDRALRVKQGLEGGRLTLPAEGDKGAAQRLQEALGRLAESRAKRTLDAEKELAADRLKVLEGFYAEGLIAEGDYWRAREGVQRDALAAELQAINGEISVRQDALAKAAKGSAEHVTATRELEEAIERRNKAERDFGRSAVENAQGARRATIAYSDAVRDLEAQLLSAQGREAESLAIRQERQNRTLRQRFEENKDTAGLEALGRVERNEQAQARFNDLRAKGIEITDRLAIAEERIQNSLRVGAISELDALQRTGEARAAAVEQLREIAAGMDALAESSGLEKLTLDADKFRAALESLKAQSDLVVEKFQTIGDQAGATFLEDVVLRTKSLKEAFTDMTNSIVRDITRIAAQDVAKRIFGGDSGSAFGEFFAKIFRGNFATGGSFKVPGAGGTDSQLVAFRATPGERVTVSTPQQATGGLSVVNHFNISGAQDPRSQQQIAAEVGASITRAMRRYN
jgi:hypothetical protein